MTNKLLLCFLLTTFISVNLLAQKDQWGNPTPSPYPLTYTPYELDSIKHVSINQRSALTSDITRSHVFYGSFSHSSSSFDFNSNYFRIPSVYITNLKSIITLTEVRHSSYADYQAGISIGIARSTDGGNTWSDKQELLSMKDWKLGGTTAQLSRVMQPTIVQDNTNTIYVFADIMNDSRNPEATHDANDLVYDIIYKKSTDDGKTWSTAFSLREKNPTLFAGTTLNQIVLGNSHSIVMENGTIVIPIYIRTTCNNKDNNTSAPFLNQSGFLYTTTPDNSASWKMSAFIPQYTSECSLIEYTTGKLMINCRGYISARRVYVTDDMGKTWTVHESDKKLIEPVACQGSSTMMKGSKRDVGFFCNPNALCIGSDLWSGRHDLTVKVTTDFKSWFVFKDVIQSASDGYSDIFYRDGMLVLLAEADKSTNRGDIDCYNLSSLLDDDAINKITGYKDVTGVDEIKTDKISIYPNPTSDYISISSSKDSEANLMIYNMNGTLVLERTVFTNTEISVRDLPKGIYLVKIKTSGNSLLIKKLIIL